MKASRANNCVQATPDYACAFFLNQGSGAPDAERWAESGASHFLSSVFIIGHLALGRDRGRDEGLNLAPPSEPDWRISRIRLSSQWAPRGARLALLRAMAKENSPKSAK